ncbi:MAG TPA: NADH-quinone oxidoreductase subunit J [Blastocatellia bacterium]|jgi:NADH-quinone oxidoreductase subunit J|nr:NADH-quinone oxidoreductase subunit J [Blastocatellia bacterium]
MEFAHILFLGFAALAVVAAFNVILQRNPIYSAIGLIAVLCSLAAIFLTLGAQFIAAMQIIVYAGAIMVLFVFVIMLLNVREEETRIDKQKYLKWLAAPLFLALLAEVMAVVRYVNLTPQPLPSANNGGEPSAVLGTVENIAHGMFTNYVIPFEAASVLILMAIVGSMLLARREKKEDVELIEKALTRQQEEEKYKEEVAA